MPLRNCRSSLSLLHQPLQVFSNSFGVGAHIASSYPRHGAYIDAATFVRRGNTDDNVIFEAEPECCVGCLDAPVSRVRIDNRPAHLAGCLKGLVEGLGRGHAERSGNQVWIGGTLLCRNVRASVFGWIGCVLSNGENRDKDRRILCVGCDVVDGRYPLGGPPP